MIWRVGAIVIAGIVALPLLGVASSLFTLQGELWRHLADTQLIDIFFNTLVLLLVVGLGTTIIGAGTAWLVTMCSFPGSRLLQWALLLPLVLPTYIIGYAYADLLTFAGPVQGALRQATGWSRGDYWFPDLGSAGGVALLFTLVLYPYVYLAARSAFLSQSHALIEASRILGHGPWRTFFGVALPLARPAVAAGVVLALLEALADFGPVQYYGVPTRTTAIDRTWYGLGNRTCATRPSPPSLRSGRRLAQSRPVRCPSSWASSCRRSIWRSSRGGRARSPSTRISCATPPTASASPRRPPRSSSRSLCS